MVAGGQQVSLALSGGTAEATVRFARPGARVARATLAGTPGLAGESDALRVRPTTLTIQGPATATAGARARYTVAAVDEQGQAVAGYEGTLVVATSDAAAGESGRTAAAGQGRGPGEAGDGNALVEFAGQA